MEITCVPHGRWTPRRQRQCNSRARRFGSAVETEAWKRYTGVYCVDIPVLAHLELSDLSSTAVSSSPCLAECEAVLLPWQLGNTDA